MCLKGLTWKTQLGGHMWRWLPVMIVIAVFTITIRIRIWPIVLKFCSYNWFAKRIAGINNLDPRQEYERTIFFVWIILGAPLSNLHINFAWYHLRKNRIFFHLVLKFYDFVSSVCLITLLIVKSSVNDKTYCQLNYLWIFMHCTNEMFYLSFHSRLSY